MKKKFLSLFAVIAIMACIVVPMFAQEQVLFDSSAKSDLDGYDYVSNFEMSSKSGAFDVKSFNILEPDEKGIRFLAYVPLGKTTNYDILTAYPSFLNDSGAGTGSIYNAADIKQIKVIGTTNRPYDEIILLYSTSPKGIVKEIKMPQNFNTIKTMEEFTLVYDNPNYVDDPKKRNVKSMPAIGSEANGIYLRGFRIKANPAGNYGGITHEDSPYSIFYLKNVSVVCDKAFTDEQLEQAKTVKEVFGIDESSVIREKEKARIKEINRVRENQKALMATESNSDAK